MRFYCTNCDTHHDDPSMVACSRCRMPDSLVVTDNVLPTEQPTVSNSSNRLCRNCTRMMPEDPGDRCPHCFFPILAHYSAPAHTSRLPFGAAALRAQSTFFTKKY